MSTVSRHRLAIHRSLLVIALAAIVGAAVLSAPPAHAYATIDDAVGREAPTFQVNTLDGDPFNFERTRGAAVIVFFFQSDCPASKQAAESLSTALAAMRAADGTAPRVVAVNLDLPRRERTQAVLARAFLDAWDEPQETTVVLGDDKVRTAYGQLVNVDDSPVSATPLLLAADDMGIVRFAASGDVPVDDLREGLAKAE